MAFYHYRVKSQSDRWATVSLVPKSLQCQTIENLGCNIFTFQTVVKIGNRGSADLLEISGDLWNM